MSQVSLVDTSIVLKYLRDRKKPVSSKEIAEDLGASKLSVVRALYHLHKRGLIGETHASRLVVTAKGKKRKPIYGSFQWFAR